MFINVFTVLKWFLLSLNTTGTTPYKVYFFSQVGSLSELRILRFNVPLLL